MPSPIDRIELTGPEEVAIGGKRYACRIGRAGVTDRKCEGDLATPEGSFALRCCYYRPDRMQMPVSGLPLIALSPEDGWCDDAAHPLYNQPVKLPFGGRHERLWREDHIYDLIIPLGYNDAPPVAGLGSAIFLHVMRPDGVGTEGCVAMAREALLALLPRLTVDTRMVIASG